MEISLVFYDWKKGELEDVGTEEYLDLSSYDFHAGSSFKGTIQLDNDDESELKAAMAAGYTPLFWVPKP